jgi:hypothetical protein
VPIKSYSKYIFSESVVEGKEINVLSKPFEMPFKIANILVLWAGDYCFISPTKEIEDEITDLNLRNINITDAIYMCPKGSRKVCFYSELPECDVFVSPFADSKTGAVTRKNERTVYYQGGLIYGAIFSNSEIYECQVKRLMMRASELALLYNAKSESVAARSSGCSSDLQADLESYAAACRAVKKSESLQEINMKAMMMKDKNERMSCKLWGEI